MKCKRECERVATECRDEEENNRQDLMFARTDEDDDDDDDDDEDDDVDAYDNDESRSLSVRPAKYSWY